MLAKLFTKPANLLVLDEPTNDLDIETLELLEEVLSEFKGTVLIVSHDRSFLDNVATSTLVFDGTGRVREFIGGFDDWLRQGGSITQLGLTEKQVEKAVEKDPVPAPVTAAPEVKAPAKKKLSYKLQRELDEMPKVIEQLEAQLEELQSKTSDPDFYAQAAAVTEPALKALVDLQAQLDAAIERWAELEEMEG